MNDPVGSLQSFVCWAGAPSLLLLLASLALGDAARHQWPKKLVGHNLKPFEASQSCECYNNRCLALDGPALITLSQVPFRHCGLGGMSSRDSGSRMPHPRACRLLMRGSRELTQMYFDHLNWYLVGRSRFQTTSIASSSSSEEDKQMSRGENQDGVSTEYRCGLTGLNHASPACAGNIVHRHILVHTWRTCRLGQSQSRGWCYLSSAACDIAWPF